MLSERQRRILEIIAARDVPTTGGAIASVLGVSVRTVQSEIARINATDTLIVSSNRGYELARLAAAMPLDTSEHPSGREAATDRHDILKLLLESDSHGAPLTIGDLSEQLYLSVPATGRRLKQLRPLLQRFNISITRKSGVISLAGSERDKRRLIGYLVTEEAGTSFPSGEIPASSFGNLDYRKTERAISTALSMHGYRIRRGYEKSLVTTIAIALERMSRGSSISDGEPPEKSPFINCARDICRLYPDMEEVEAGDVSYLASLLMGQIEPCIPDDAITGGIEFSDFVRRIERIVNDVLETFSLHIDFSQELYNFAQHIRALIERADGVQIASADMLENIKMTCPFVYELSVLISQKLAAELDITIEDDELGFVCIHVGMLVESARASELVHISLLCDQYRSLSTRIEEELGRRFSDIVLISTPDHVDAVDENRTEMANGRTDDGIRKPNQIDLIITTRNALGGRRGVVLISPFFTTSDLLKIESAIGLCLKRKHAARTYRLLSPFFSKDLFFRTAEALDREQTISFLGEKLVDAGVVDTSFIDSVRTREDLSSTSFFNLFALPHALDMNARKTMVAALVDERGVAWGDETVSVVLMIAVCRDDRGKFMEIYDAVARALCDERRARRLAASTSLDEFLELLVYE